MRINSILIENFRAIRFLKMENLSKAIVIAGPNGCGKSCVFDAIRLVKSAYGQYINNEFSSWFNEFQININTFNSSAKGIFHNPSLPMKIEIEFSLDKSEIEFLKSNAKKIYEKISWSQLARSESIEGEFQFRNPKTKLTDSKVIGEKANKLTKSLLEAIDNENHRACFEMKPGEYPSTIGSPVLELMFSIYQPKDLGVIDYQPPTRNYTRERVGNLNLTIQNGPEAKGAQNALYGTQNKYSGVKNEMAQSYIMELLAERAGIPAPDVNTLQSTLDELFTIFFPGKKFLGAIPTKDGGLEFPIQLENGTQHDINELSSGEKEVLLGYLRLRNGTPKNSIILLDEPELHLNPRLAKGLPRFYQKHLGTELGNQLWLVSHSDAILREAVLDPNFNVYHMQNSHQTNRAQNQVDQLNASIDTENAIIDLVGDLAAYNPRSKIVLLEGEDSEFDAKLITELFPEFVERVNLVSLGSKSTVRNAHRVLEQAAENGKLDARFYSIVDQDYAGPNITDNSRRYSWDVYHIENFLLSPKHIMSVLSSLQLGNDSPSESSILDLLKLCAKETAPELIKIQMNSKIHSNLISAISLSFESKLENTEGFRKSIQRSERKFSEISNSLLSNGRIENIENEISEKLNNSLESNSWLKEFRGRNILKLFSGKEGISYEILRNLIIDRMKSEGHKPKNMNHVIEDILKN